MAETRKVYYDSGPLNITFGKAGQFRLGVPRDIPSDLADILLRKGVVKEYVDVAKKRKTEV